MALAILALLGATAFASHAQTAVVPKSFAGAKQPQVAVTVSNVGFVAFGKGNSIYVARSTNSATSFEPPQLVSTVPKLALGMRRGPRIVSTANAIAISAISHDDGNLYCWVSNDDGVHWTKGARVNDGSGAAREGLHAMAAHGNTVAMAWLDLRSGKTDLRGAVSKDSGATWSTNFVIYQSPDGHICECCHPNIAFGPDGKLFVVWRNWLNRSRDLYLAESNDLEHFGAAEKLGTGSWPLNACPMDGGGLAINTNGAPVTVWRRGTEILSSGNGTAEQSVASESSQPCLAITAAGTNVVWHTHGGLMLRTPHQQSPFQFAASGKFPSISALGDKVIVVWETGETDAPIVAKIFR
ncbi:MAG: hypothetical protein JWO95_1375 [Verrucomicrobiales bacterium]|nr:hypothetical protein [Verrucomicrobiales bacterium]